MLASGKLSWYSERPLARQMGEGVSERKKMTLDDAADRSLLQQKKKRKSPFVGREVQKRARRAPSGLGRAMEKAYCNYRPWPQIKLALSLSTPFFFLSSLYNILCLTIAYTIIYIQPTPNPFNLIYGLLLWSRRLFR